MTNKEIIIALKIASILLFAPELSKEDALGLAIEMYNNEYGIYSCHDED